MSNIERRDPISDPIVNGSLPPTFADLVALNAGMVLEPLASRVPIAELHPAVINGIAGLPKELVSDIITDHSENPETALLRGRLKDIRQIAKTILRQETLAPVTIPSVKPAEVAPRTLAELIQEKIFDSQAKPNVDGLSAIIARSPADPSTVHQIDRAFRDNGYDLDDEANTELGTSVAKSLSHGYGKYLIKNPRYRQDHVRQRLIKEWFGRLNEAESIFGRSMQQAVIRTLIIYHKTNRPSDLLELAYAIVEGREELMKKLVGQPEEVIDSLVSSPMSAIRDKILNASQEVRQAASLKAIEDRRRHPGWLLLYPQNRTFARSGSF